MANPFRSLVDRLRWMAQGSSGRRIQFVLRDAADEIERLQTVRSAEQELRAALDAERERRTKAEAEHLIATQQIQELQAKLKDGTGPLEERIRKAIAAYKKVKLERDEFEQLLIEEQRKVQLAREDAA